jgi:hypothetical protein
MSQDVEKQIAGEYHLKAVQKKSTPKKRKFHCEELGYSIGVYIDKLIPTSKIPKRIVIDMPDIDLGL